MQKVNPNMGEIDVQCHWTPLELVLNYTVTVVSKHFIVDVALGRVGVATEGRTSQLIGDLTACSGTAEPFLHLLIFNQ
jgi:hypothetical protein